MKVVREYKGNTLLAFVIIYNSYIGTQYSGYVIFREK